MDSSDGDSRPGPLTVTAVERLETCAQEDFTASHRKPRRVCSCDFGIRRSSLPTQLGIQVEREGLGLCYTTLLD
jgi:hypothetical protein